MGKPPEWSICIANSMRPRLIEALQKSNLDGHSVEFSRKVRLLAHELAETLVSEQPNIPANERTQITETVYGFLLKMLPPSVRTPKPRGARF